MILKTKNRLFGRTKGRNKKKIFNNNYFEIIQKYKIKKLYNSKKYILDIGSGYGETTIFLAKQYPEHRIIACEKYIDGNINLIKNIRTQKIKNIDIYPGNVIDVLDQYNNKSYFDIISIFFPDPWPKKKHHKRRLISYEFLKKIYYLIRMGGEIIIVTDSISYSRSIINTIYKSRNFFDWKNQSSLYLCFKYYYDLETKFYKKAIISGRNTSIFILKKI